MLDGRFHLPGGKGRPARAVDGVWRPIFSALPKDRGCPPREITRLRPGALSRVTTVSPSMVRHGMNRSSPAASEP